MPDDAPIPSDTRLIDSLIERTTGGLGGEDPDMLNAASAHERVDVRMACDVVEASLRDFPAAVRVGPKWPGLVRAVAERLMDDPTTFARLESLHRKAREQCR
jgi:hypothetical protein